MSVLLLLLLLCHAFAEIQTFLDCPTTLGEAKLIPRIAGAARVGLKMPALLYFISFFTRISILFLQEMSVEAAKCGGNGDVVIWFSILSCVNYIPLFLLNYS